MGKALYRLIGSPFAIGDLPIVDEGELLRLYDCAFENRVALLYLSLHRRPGWHPELESRFQALEARWRMTQEVIARLVATLDQVCPGEFLVFKSLKPYPATPNDTDVLFMGPKSRYERAYQFLLDNGYFLHEWAPQQRTVCDPRGAGKTGKGKKGGVYYIDLYEEISTDYFAYLDKHRLQKHRTMTEIDGQRVPTLRPEPELAIVLFHSVFPERTFQMEHFYLPLYALADPGFDLELFIRFSRENRLAGAVRASLALCAAVHQAEFGKVPRQLQRALEALGTDRAELGRFKQAGRPAPYRFSPRLFWMSFLLKLRERYALRTALVQLWMLRDRRFFKEVFASIRRRLGEEPVYRLE